MFKVKFWQKWMLWVFILTASIWLTINSVPLYWIFMAIGPYVQNVGLSIQDVMKDYMHILMYIQVPWIPSLQLQYLTLSVNGIHHFVQVRHLVLIVESLCLASAPSVYLAYCSYKAKTLWQMYQEVKAWQLLPIPFICLMMTGFNRFFYWFHKFLFSDQTWQFNPRTDNVILVLPSTFFMACFIVGLIYYYSALYLIQFYIKKIWKEAG